VIQFDQLEGSWVSLAAADARFCYRDGIGHVGLGSHQLNAKALGQTKCRQSLAWGQRWRAVLRSAPAGEQQARSQAAEKEQGAKQSVNPQQ